MQLQCKRKRNLVQKKKIRWEKKIIFQMKVIGSSETFVWKVWKMLELYKQHKN